MADLRCRAVTLPVAVTFEGQRISGVTFLPSARRQIFPVGVARQFTNYFAGKKVSFRVPIDLSAGTIFQRKVWRALQAIPYGQTRSYAWVAKRIGQANAVRAVGAACGANPVPVIIPCHRVVRSDGSMGGFSAGLEWKKRLLALESCR